MSVPSLVGRLVVVAAGFGLALTGWMLVMPVLLVFIGLPMFFFGLAVMQYRSAEGLAAVTRRAP